MQHRSSCLHEASICRAVLRYRSAAEKPFSPLRIAASIWSDTPVNVCDSESCISTASRVRSSTLSSAFALAICSWYSSRPLRSEIMARDLFHVRVAKSARASSAITQTSLNGVHHGGSARTFTSAAVRGSMAKPRKCGNNVSPKEFSNSRSQTPVISTVDPALTRRALPSGKAMSMRSVCFPHLSTSPSSPSSKSPIAVPRTRTVFPKYRGFTLPLPFGVMKRLSQSMSIGISPPLSPVSSPTTLTSASERYRLKLLVRTNPTAAMCAPTAGTSASLESTTFMA